MPLWTNKATNIKSQNSGTGNIEYVTAKHYHEACHGSPDTLHLIGLEHVTPPARGGNLPKLLYQRQIYWISTLNTVTPAGLYDDFSLKSFLRATREHVTSDRTVKLYGVCHFTCY